MTNDGNIWDQVGTSTLDRDEQGEIDLPPLAGQDGNTGPLREVLQQFPSASPEARSRYSLRLDNADVLRTGHLGIAVESGLPDQMILGLIGKRAQ